MQSASTSSSSTFKKPAYRKQKRTGKPALAFVEIKGQRRYLGEFNSEESHQKHKQLVAELQRAGGQLPSSNPDDLLIVELVTRYWSFAELHYRKADGTPTSELDLLKRAANVLVEPRGVHELIRCTTL